MNARWASDPAFLVRFTREAYAAAQLVHHNVVQVYDIGEDQGISYFSMEYVEGESLGDLLKKKGKLDPAEAAGYVLQAARGLKFAHERGMVHRDIKPDNLMLNNQGIVKVADLGLVRTPGMLEERPGGEEEDVTARAAAVAKAALSGKGSKSGASLSSLTGVTMAGQAMGTPAYMAPEQARDATTIDHRADIYSLGCSLYTLVTGRPVFSGESAMEVLTKHACEPVRRPETIVKDLPKGLPDIILKMIAKKPQERHSDCGALIGALEGFLGTSKVEAGEEQLGTLERCVKAFAGSTTARVRGMALLGFFGACAALFLIFLVAGWWRIAGGVLGLGVLTGLSYFVVQGVLGRTYLFGKVREFVLGASLTDHLKWAGGLVLLLAVWWLLGLLWVWLAAGVLAVAIAFCLHFLLDRRIGAERAKAVEAMEGMLKRLRLRGVSEEAVQEFVCTNAGEHWEEFFEALFGYEAKLEARARWGRGPRGARPKYAAWRDPLVRWIDQAQRARQAARERKHLQAVEAKNLQALGVGAAEARQQAERVAEAMVQKAAEIKKEEAQVKQSAGQQATVPGAAEETTAPGGLPRPAPPRRVNVQEMFYIAEQRVPAPARPGRALARQVASLFGGGPRFLIGALLLVVCLLWMNRRDLLPRAEDAEKLFNVSALWAAGQEAKPLSLPVIPEGLLKPVCSLNAGVLGLLMMLSAIWFSWKIGVFQYAGAFVAIAGPLFVPSVAGLSPELASLATGAGLSVLGFVFGRDT
jgi:hypothetical protein